MNEIYIVICDGMVQYVSASGAQPTTHVLCLEDLDPVLDGAEELSNLLQVANQLPRVW